MSYVENSPEVCKSKITENTMRDAFLSDCCKVERPDSFKDIDVEATDVSHDTKNMGISDIKRATIVKTFFMQNQLCIRVLKIDDDDRFFCLFAELVKNMGFVKPNFKPEQPVGKVLINQNIQFVKAYIKGERSIAMPYNMVEANKVPSFLEEFIRNNKAITVSSNKNLRFQKSIQLLRYFSTTIIPSLYNTARVETPEVNQPVPEQPTLPFSEPTKTLSLNTLMQQFADALKCPVNEVRVAAKALYCKHNPIVKDLFGEQTP